MSKFDTTDIIHGLLETSDPLITSLRDIPRTKKRELHSSAKKLIVVPENEEESDSGEYKKKWL